MMNHFLWSMHFKFQKLYPLFHSTSTLRISDLKTYDFTRIAMHILLCFQSLCVESSLNDWQHWQRLTNMLSWQIIIHRNSTKITKANRSPSVNIHWCKRTTYFFQWKSTQNNHRNKIAFSERLIFVHLNLKTSQNNFHIQKKMKKKTHTAAIVLCALLPP